MSMCSWLAWKVAEETYDLGVVDHCPIHLSLTVLANIPV